MPDRVLAGTPAAPGTAAGVVCFYRTDPGTKRSATSGPSAFAPSNAGPVDRRHQGKPEGQGAARGEAVEQPGRPLVAERRPAEAARAAQALAAAGAEVAALAARLRVSGRGEEAEIVETGTLLAADPALRAAVERAVLEEGRRAPDALVAAAESQAALLAALDDFLAARAADVRSLGQRAARLAAHLAFGDSGGAGRDGGAGNQADTGGGRDAVPRAAEKEAASGVVVVAEDLGPADVADLGPEVRAIALAAGSAAGHAAIVARSLGVPMVVGLGPAALQLLPGLRVVVDGAAGTVTVAPEAGTAGGQPARPYRGPDSARPENLPERQPGEWPGHVAPRGLNTASPGIRHAVTVDGRRVRVLANVAGPAEVAAAVAAGAEGVGLLRTEIPFLHAGAWPSLEDHRQRLRPMLAPLAGRTATVRLLDFGADKTPPFLRGTPERGIRLLGQAPAALAAQLQAALETGRETDLRLLVPMVVDPDDVRLVRQALAAVRTAFPFLQPCAVGAMVEVPAAAAMARRLAHEAGFFSIGTNDLSHFCLGYERAGPTPAPAHHPAVLRLIADTVEAGHAAGIPVAVCGEAAADPLVLPLLVGLGVDELSAGAARIGAVRDWVGRLHAQQAEAVARRALDAASAAEVAALAAPLRRLLEPGEDAGQRLQGGGGVLAVRAQA